MSFERRFRGFRGQNRGAAAVSQKPSFLRDLRLFKDLDAVRWRIAIDGDRSSRRACIRADEYAWIPDIEVHLLEAGHFALDEKVDEIARLMIAFLEKRTWA
jgi:hypothetical protein